MKVRKSIKIIKAEETANDDNVIAHLLLIYIQQQW